MPKIIQKASDRGLVQLKLPPGLVKNVDRLASQEMISRTAWIRRLVLNAARQKTK